MTGRPQPRLKLTSLVTAVALTLLAATSPAAAAPPFPDRVDLPDSWRPEGISSSGTTAWVGSLADGAIWEANLRTGVGGIAVPGVAGRVAVGVDYEAERDRLWVAGGDTGFVRVHDASSGDLLAEYEVEAGFLNDVVVTGEAAYVTDSGMAQLIVIPLGDDGALPADAESIPLSGDIVYDPAAFNVNGIDDAHGSLLVVQSNTGLLFRVDPDTGVTDALEGTYDATLGDGLEVRGNTAWVVRNFVSTIAVLSLDGRLTTATEIGTITSPQLDVPTTATIAAGSLWAVNARFTTPPAGAAYWITKLPLTPTS